MNELMKNITFSDPESFLLQAKCLNEYQNKQYTKKPLSNAGHDERLCYLSGMMDRRWIIMDRRQRVKLSSDCFSECGTVPSGVPQGTKLGSWVFILMINDLQPSESDVWKYVDDTTLA